MSNIPFYTWVKHYEIAIDQMIGIPIRRNGAGRREIEKGRLTEITAQEADDLNAKVMVEHDLAPYLCNRLSTRWAMLADGWDGTDGTRK